MFYNDYDILTAYEAMEYLGIGENSLYRLLKSGELGAFRIGRIWKYYMTANPIHGFAVFSFVSTKISKNLQFH